MGLRRTFQAQDVVPYRRWVEGSCSTFPGLRWNEDLITPPRIYAEELTALEGRPGAIWGGLDPNRWDQASISFFGVTRQVCWPSWGTGRWRFDAQAGRFLDRLVGGTTFSGLSVGMGLLTTEPDGTLWEFGGHPFLDESGAARFDRATLSSTGEILRPADFEGGAGLAMKDFAIDRPADRVWIRWLTSGVGQVSVYRLSTKAKLHEIFAPNRTIGITLTHDGFLYLADELDWLCVYDYDGRLFNAFRNPRTGTPPLGVCYGWDQFYKRLLRLEGTAGAADGASTLRVEAFYPQPEAAILTPPIPRCVPRVGRKLYLVSHVCGEGAEPIAGQPVQLTGIARLTAPTDVLGDAVHAVTPGAAGEATATVTTGLATLEQPAVDETPPTVELTLPLDGATVGTPVQLEATAEDPSGIDRVEFRDGATVVATVTSGPYRATWAAPAGAHTLTARAVDRAGNDATSAPATITVDAEEPPPPPPPPPAGEYPPDQAALVKYAQPVVAEPALLGAAIVNDFGGNAALNTRTRRVSNTPHHYAKNSPWNCDETLARVGSSILDGTTYAVQRSVSLPNEHKTWSNIDPRFVYGANRDQRQWVRVDATTGASSVLKTYSALDVGLSSLSRVSFGDYEGNLDNADTGAVLIANGVRPFLIDPKTGAVRVLVTGGGGYGREVSDATISQDGQWILVNWVGYGIDAYRASDGGWHRKLTSRNSHYDAGVSSSGAQVVVQASGSNGLEMVNISTGASTWVYSGETWFPAHVSCRNVRRPGWAYLSSFSDGSADELALDTFHRVFAVKLDGSQVVENFAWDHAAVPAAYADSPMAAASPTGTRVWWKVNWNGASAGIHSFVAEV